MRHQFQLVTTVCAIAAMAVAGCGSSGGGTGKNEASGYGAPGGNTSTSSASNASGTTATSGAAGTGTSAAGAGGSGTAIGTMHTSLGTILVAGPKHLSVYLWEADTGSTSTCSGACAQVWPPVTTSGAPRAEGGAVAADLGTTTRSDGTKQVTYKGHPLYWYTGDSQAGETTGQGSTGFGAGWWVMAPSGSKIS